MTQAREHSFYIHEHIALADKRHRKINMFIAVTSCSSIGAWAIWHSLSWLWGIIIAGSQVINAIRPYFPYEIRLAALFPLRNELEQLCLDIERKWFDIANGDMAERDIHEYTSELRAKKTEMEQKHIGNIVLPYSKSMVDEAKIRNKNHFNNIL
jgi:hypothetical protein